MLKALSKQLRGYLYSDAYRNASTTTGETTPLTETKRDDNIHNSVYGFNDKESDQTIGRLVSRRLSQTTKWYNPSKNLNAIPKIIPGKPMDGTITVPPPNLDDSWEFYEHQVLPRRFVGFGQRRAEPGESEEQTKLYSLFDTSLDDMGGFGIGVGLYFNTLKFFAIMCFIAGCINIPNMVFFSSNYYAKDDDELTSGLPFALRTSAVCTDTSWEPCPTCLEQDFRKFPANQDRLAFANVGGNALPFILKNNCEMSGLVGFITIITILFVSASLFYFVYLQNEKAIEIDHSMQTSRDYSIEVENPPHDARDPEMWKAFFENKFEGVHVTVCTVVVDNEDLVELLVKRRTLYQKLRNSLPREVELTNDNLHDVLEFAPKGKGFDKVVERIHEADEQIKILGKEDFDASSIFITFEKQAHQNRVLAKMALAKTKQDGSYDHLKFQRKVLSVVEPAEPSSIRWADLDESRMTKFIQRIVTFLASFLIIFGGAYFIIKGSEHSSTLSSIVIVVLNEITPMLVRKLSSVESHSNQSSYSGSLYLKITAVRWANTAIITRAVTPFTDLIRSGDYLLESITVLFTAEILQRPIMQLLDFGGNIKRHYSAPRAPDQRRMDLCFISASYDIGERYTDISKVLFLAFFYCTLMPASFFYAAIIFAVYYWMDKYLILNVWRQAPRINEDISIVSIYTFVFNIMVYVTFATFTIAQFPYDDACAVNDESVPDDYMKVTTLETFSKEAIEISVDGESAVYKFCDQNLLGSKFSLFPFPALLHQEEWMSPLQVSLDEALGWIGMIIYILVVIAIFYRLITKNVLPYFTVTESIENADSNLGFSEVDEIYGYVPQVKISGSLYPKLLCNIDKDCYDLVGWNDPRKDGYSGHNLMDDVEEKSANAFSVVRKWSPKKLLT